MILWDDVDNPPHKEIEHLDNNNAYWSNGFIATLDG